MNLVLGLLGIVFAAISPWTARVSYQMQLFNLPLRVWFRLNASGGVAIACNGFFNSFLALVYGFFITMLVLTFLLPNFGDSFMDE